MFLDRGDLGFEPAVLRRVDHEVHVRTCSCSAIYTARWLITTRVLKEEQNHRNDLDFLAHWVRQFTWQVGTG